MQINSFFANLPSLRITYFWKYLQSKPKKRCFNTKLVLKQRFKLAIFDSIIQSDKTDSAEPRFYYLEKTYLIPKRFFKSLGSASL